MITIHFSPIESLPEASIEASGPVSRAFLRRGVTSFHQAASYVQQLPYGYNRTSENVMVLFEDGFGTCLTKHGLIARLAEEVGIGVQRYEGFYPLTDKIVTGVNAILAEYNLPYIPRTHCFLSHENGYVDLTEGNCTGKNGVIETYLEIFQVRPEQTEGEADEINRSYYSKICAEDPVFGRVGVERLLEVLQLCTSLNKALCLRPHSNHR